MSDTPFDGFSFAPRRVVHPLDDAPEQKLYSAGLPPMRMTRGVRLSLMALQAYLALMGLLVIWRVVGLVSGSGV